MLQERKLVYMLEDDSDDRSITESTISELQLPINLHFFSNSSHFLSFLQAAPKASIILLDYNSHPDNGLQVLKNIKGYEVHKSTPVIILSDNSLPHYKDECYAHGASSFIQKPALTGRSKEMIEKFFSYWFNIVQV